MLSRAAESLYWMARYLERAENTARLINATQQLLLDLPQGASVGWEALTRIVGLGRLFEQSYARADEASVVDFLVSSPRNPGSIQSCIRFARENCRTMRDVLPRDLWQRVNTLYLASKRYSQPGIARQERRRMLEELISDRQAVSGVLATCMSHDVAWEFIGLGEHLERADMTTRILDIQTAILMPRQGATDPALALLWVGVLNSLSALQMFRRHAAGAGAGNSGINAENVLHYLVHDTHFPRSVDFCLDAIETHLAELPHNAEPLRALRTARRRADGGVEVSGDPERRHDFLDDIQTDLARIHDAIAREYFHLHERDAVPPSGLQGEPLKHVDPGRTEPHHPLPVRPASQAGAAAGAAAAGATQSHTNTLVFAAR
ncbi:MAG: alpha-E domain-containing protein [Pseudomonadota bacterium]|nr:alpha-E domain-containing protein [Pseudomonadota bacterium]